MIMCVYCLSVLLFRGKNCICTDVDIMPRMVDYWLTFAMLRFSQHASQALRLNFGIVPPVQLGVIVHYKCCSLGPCCQLVLL